MTIDDESLLTAYLDGELDPPRRSAFESALLSDPDLAERFRRLVALRDLMSTLPRPALAADLSAAVVERIGRRSRIRLTGTLGGLSLAASILVAIGLALHGGRPARSPRRGTSDRPTLALAKTDPPGSSRRKGEERRGAEGAPEESGSGSGSGSGSDTAVEASSLVRALASVSRPGGRGRDGDVEEERARQEGLIHEMLDSPDLHRVLIVNDEIGGGARDRVEELVQKTPRTEAGYGRITVSQGLVIDPRRPNEATVFALVMNDQELRHFQAKLERTLPGRVESTDADPEVVTQLADVGPIAVLPGTTGPVVFIPDDIAHPAVALRTDERRREAVRHSSEFNLPGATGSGRLETAPEPPAEADTRANRPGEAPRRDEEAPARPDPPAPAPAPARGDGPVVPGGPVERSPEAIARNSRLNDPPRIVLVWVTTR